MRWRVTPPGQVVRKGPLPVAFFVGRIGGHMDGTPSAIAAPMGPYRIHRQLVTWHDGRTPADGPPDAIDDTATWHEADGTEITDPVRIAALDASLVTTTEGQG